MKTKTKSAIVLLGLTLAGWPAQAADKWDLSTLDLSKLPAAAAKTEVTYAKDIRPLFEASCLRCHGEKRQSGKLRLDALEAALKGGQHGKAVVAADSKNSLVVIAAAQLNDQIAMPPKRGRGGPGGPGGPGGQGGPGEPPAGGPPGGDPPAGGPPGGDPPPGAPDGGGGPGGPGGAGGPGGGFGPPPKALTAEQVGLIRAWIDQGAK